MRCDEKKKKEEVKEFDAKDEDELLEQVTLWHEVDKDWDKGWERVEPKEYKKHKKRTSK